MTIDFLGMSINIIGLLVFLLIVCTSISMSWLTVRSSEEDNPSVLVKNVTVPDCPYCHNNKKLAVNRYGCCINCGASLK